jgi:hypothetical protein
MAGAAQSVRFVQLDGPQGRRLAIVDEPVLRLLNGFDTIFELAQACVVSGGSMGAEAGQRLSGETTPYDEVYDGKSDWRILPAADHPQEGTRCLVTGTG